MQLAAFSGYQAETDENDNVTTIYVNFTSMDIANGLQANYPCLIKVPSTIESFDVDEVVIEPIEEPIVATVPRTRKQWSEMIGNYIAGTTVPAHCLFISGQKFYYSKGLTKIKAFRAYFDFYDELSEVESAFSGVSMTFDDTNGINCAKSESKSSMDVYDLQGRKVASDGKAPRANIIYIVNGKKVVVR